MAINQYSTQILTLVQNVISINLAIFPEFTDVTSGQTDKTKQTWNSVSTNRMLMLYV